MSADKEQMKIVIVGHVDHGKSTLVGRLFYDTDSLPEGKYEQIQQMCKKRGMQFEWSFLMDALQAERDQEITIDTTQIWFKSKLRNYVIIDAPGHKEFLKNMISGAASSDAALLIIDASEGVKEQSKRHGYLLHLLGVDQITVAVNKMDLVGYSEAKFKQIEKEYRNYLKDINVVPTHIIPISAKTGENIANKSANMSWYKGKTIVEALDDFKLKPENNDLPLRFPIQDVYRFDEHKRILAGRIESGKLKVGDKLLFSPSNKTSKIASVEFWGKDLTKAYSGMSVGITLEEQIFIERGEIASKVKNPPILTNLFRAKLFWLSNKELSEKSKYTLKVNCSEYKVEVRNIERVIKTDDLSHSKDKLVRKNDVAEVVFKVKGLAALDEFTSNNKTGRFMLLDGYNVAGGGIISMEGFSDQRVAGAHQLQEVNIDVISPELRATNNGHSGGVLWLFGPHGAGKTSAAYELEKKLFAKAYQTYVLDEDNLRSTISENLGEGQNETIEHIRRSSNLASILSKAGMIVICTLNSPKQDHRRRARNIICNNFHSVYLSSGKEICDKRLQENNSDLKNDEFEIPDNADLTIDSGVKNLKQVVDILEEYVENNFVKTLKQVTDEVIGGGI